MSPRTFRRSGDKIRARLEAVEVQLLRSTRDQLHSALERRDPADPIVRRLFPPMVLGDEQAESELHDRFYEELLADRLRGLDALVDLLDRGEKHRDGVRLELVEDEPLLVVGVLNDLRLAIGASIDIEALDRDRVDEDDALAYRLAVMDHFAWLQEQLLAVLDPESVRHRDPWEELDDDGDIPDGDTFG